MAASLWTMLALLMVFIAPLMFAFSRIVHGDQGPLFSGAVGGIAGVLIGSYLDREFRRLPRASRLKVLAVQRSAEPSGDHDLDQIALNRLARATLAYPRNHITAPTLLTIISVIYVAIPVIAAFLNSGWLLLCLLPSPLLGADLWTAWRQPDPSHKWERLLHALSQ